MTAGSANLTPKLAVILHADVVGSTALIQINEVIAHERIRAAFTVLSSYVRKYGGTVHEIRGDALLAEFSRASDAVAASLAFQIKNIAFNSQLDDGVAPEIRIGLSLGEVIIADGTLTGADVVLAQRLEQLAQPNAICVSDNVRQSMPGRLPFVFTHLGEQQLKGFDTPVTAYQVSLQQTASPPSPHRTATKKERLIINSRFALAILVLLFLGGGFWGWMSFRTDFSPVDPNSMALPLPDKPSIAILPFVNLGNDTADDIIGEGIADSTISILSTSPDIFVISRGSSFKFRGKSVSPQEVAKALGVRYVLEGSVQRAGAQLRIAMQLADAVSGRNLWSERIDTSVDDLFAVQDELIARIVENLQVELTVGSQARSWMKVSGSPQAFIKSMRARALFQRFSLAGHSEAERIWRELLAQYPNMVYDAMIGWIHWQKVVLGISADPAADLKMAQELGQIVLERYPDTATGYILLGTVALRIGQHDAAVRYAEKALETEPGSGDTNSLAANIFTASGMPERAIPVFQRGMRYEPDFPHWVPTELIHALIMVGRFDDARDMAETLLESSSDDVRTLTNTLRHLAIIEDLSGNGEKSKYYMNRFKELLPNFTTADATQELKDRFKEQAYVKLRVDALRRAGLPDA